MDAGGNFVIVWWNTNGLYARLFTADGTPRGANFQVTGSNHEFDVAMESNGDFVVTWQELEFERNYHPGFEVRVKMYDALGNAKGEDFGVSPIADTRITRPRIAMDADGDFVVVHYQASVDGRPSGAVLQRFDQNGQRVGQPVFVSSDVYLATAEEPFAVAMAPAGQFVIAWRRFRAGTQGTEIVAARYDANGILQNSIFAVSEKINVKDPKVRFDADGDFVVSWGRYFGPSDPTGFLRLEYYARRYFADGRPQTGQFRSGGQLISSLSNGDFLVSSFPNARWYTISPNAPPVANDDSYSVNQNANLIAASVRANDMDADGFIPGDETYLDGPPDHGTVFFNEHGSFRYIPDRDFVGVDSFTYHVNGDNGLVSNVATVTINVNAIAGRSTFSATNILLPFGSAPGPIAGWAQFNPANPNGGPYQPTYTVNRADISVTPDGTLTLGGGAGGADGTFTVTLNDGQGGIDVQTFTLGSAAIPDGAVTLFDSPFDGRMLVVTAANRTYDVSIHGSSLPGEVFVEGSLGNYRARGVTGALMVRMREGGGLLNVHDLYLAGVMNITSGSGDDHLRLGVDGVVSHEKGLIVNSGAGNDTIDILDLYVAGTGTIEGDAGDDAINLYNPDLPAGAFQISYSSTSYSRIVAGDGNDAVTVHYAFVPHTFEVYDHGGSDLVTIFGSAFSDTLSIYADGGGNVITIDTNYLPAGFNFIGSEGVDVLIYANNINEDEVLFFALGSGGDSLVVRNASAEAITVLAGGGADSVDIRSSLLELLYAELDADSDLFTAYGNSVTGSLYLDGGDGLDRLLDLSNSFSPLYVRERFELFG